MVKQNFVGEKPVDSFPPEAIQKIPEEQLTKSELQRLSESESKGADKVPGANKRAGVATRDPAQFDPKHRGGQGDHLPATEDSVV